MKKHISLILIALLVPILWIKTAVDQDLLKEASNVLVDSETISARKSLKYIEANKRKINTLVSFCLKREVTPPIYLRDISVCNEKAYEVLGITETLSQLKKKANRPLYNDYTKLKEIRDVS